jgi:hypothetical protein
MIEGKYPWTYVGISAGKPLYFNEEDGSIAVEDVQEGQLFTPREPVILEEVTTAATMGPAMEALIASWGG